MKRDLRKRPKNKWKQTLRRNLQKRPLIYEKRPTEENHIYLKRDLQKRPTYIEQEIKQRGLLNLSDQTWKEVYLGKKGTTVERWGAGVEYRFQEFNEPYAPS